MRVVIVAASVVLVIAPSTVVALATGAWAADSAVPKPPKCSALNTQRHGRLVGGERNGRWYVRYCGPGRAVLRVGDKTFRIEGGTCSGHMGSVNMGLVGYGGLRGKGFDAHLAFEGRHRQPGRNPIIDGETQLPGFGLALPHQGMSMFSKDLMSATFTLGGPPRITGTWTCR